MKNTLLNQKAFRFIVLFVSLTSLLVSCSKDEVVTEITEDPSIKVPATTVKVDSSGNLRTATITGKFYQLYFDQIYHKSDGSLPGDKPTVRTTYWLRYDKVTISSNGNQPFTFERTAPYIYTMKYTMSPNDYEVNRITLVSNEGTYIKEF